MDRDKLIAMLQFGVRPPPPDALGGDPRFTDFTQSSNIEDRRAEPQQFDPGAMATSLGNYMWGMPALPEVPPTELGRNLGLNDIKIEPNVGPSALDQLIGALQDNWHQAKSLGRAVKKEI